MKITQTTTTSLVLEALVAADDFMGMAALVAATSRSPSRVGAALHHLKTHKAVDCVDADGVLYWLATPDSDDRSRKLAEIVPDYVKPKRRARKVAKPTPTAE